MLARKISARLDCDVHRIEAVDPYPADYDETVERNVREQDTTRGRRSPTCRRRSTATPPILLASPIWNVRAPMIMSTFTEAFDFTRKTVLRSPRTP